MSVSVLTPTQIKQLETKLHSIRQVIKKPKSFTGAQKLSILNSALALAKISVNLQEPPPSIVVLTPASPKSTNGKNYIELYTKGQWLFKGMYGEFPNGAIILDEKGNGAIKLSFETTSGRNYAVELETSISNASPNACWEIVNLTDYSKSTYSHDSSLIMVAFTAKSESSSLWISYNRNLPENSFTNDVPFFFGCKLIAIE